MQIPEECAASLQLLRLDDAIEVSDWERFYRFSISQSFSGPMERKIICQAPAKYQLLERIRQAKKKKRVDALAKAVAEITQGAIKHKVRFAIIKGFSFSALLYDSPYDRTLSDIDTLVNDVDMPKMDALLRSLGFRQFAAVEGGVELELPFPILKANGHHEYFEYKKVIDDVEVIVEVSRWFHVNLQDRTDAFLSRSITRHFGGLDFPSLSEEDCAVNLLENAYHNSFGIRSNLFKGVARLKDIEDVVRLRKYAQKETLTALVAQYPFADKILSLAEELCSSELSMRKDGWELCCSEDCASYLMKILDIKSASLKYRRQTLTAWIEKAKALNKSIVLRDISANYTFELEITAGLSFLLHGVRHLSERERLRIRIIWDEQTFDYIYIYTERCCLYLSRIRGTTHFFDDYYDLDGRIQQERSPISLQDGFLAMGEEFITPPEGFECGLVNLALQRQVYQSVFHTISESDSYTLSRS